MTAGPLRIDATLEPRLERAAAAARSAESVGHDGLWVAEVSSDPFLPLAVAAEHSADLLLGTSIAVGFARSPMTIATQAHDLQRFSGGRFVLGLGSQIEPHITRRFSMPWSEPAARMREMIQAVRAIWACWNEGAPLDFRGRFYTHTLMTPFFDPGPTGYGPPPVYLAAVGPLMTAVAAEVADGLFLHPFTTERYLHEVTLPALEGAFSAAGRSRKGFEVCLPAFVVTGRDDAELQAAASRARTQIAFYGSTPAYRRVLELHGWGRVGVELNRLSRDGAWDQMPALVDDEVLHAFAAVGSPEAVAAELLRRYGGVVDRLSFATQDGSDVPAELVRALRAPGRPGG